MALRLDNSPSVFEGDWLVQEMVLDAFHECWSKRRNIKRSVHIFHIIFKVWKIYDVFLTYKQVRNALYRLRRWWNIEHVGRGYYWMVIT